MSSRLRLAQSLYRELDVLRLDLSPAFYLGLVPILWVSLEIFPGQLAREGQVPGELFTDVGIARHRP
jgi:hypothetical protein